MDTKIQFRIDEETKAMAMLSAQQKGITLSNACREFVISLAREEISMKNESKTTNDLLNKKAKNTFEKIRNGQSKVHSHNEAVSLMELNKQKAKEKYRQLSQQEA